MDNFEKRFPENNLFEEIDDEILKIYLRTRVDHKDVWERNPNNTISYEQLISKISSMPVLVYFQKQKPDERKRDRQKLIIQIGEEKAVELRTATWTIDENLYNRKFCLSLGKFREIDFFNPPSKNTIPRKCQLRIVLENEQEGSNDPDFIQLLQGISKLNLPTQEINKEKDQQIWLKYVEALKKLIKQKEQIWKIQKVGSTYSRSLDKFTQDRANFVDITINETDLAEKFEEDLVEYFGEDELDDHGASNDDVYLTFNSFRELDEEEESNIKELAPKYFFMLSEEPPIYSITGELKFKYSEDETHNQVIEKLKDILDEEYEINLESNDKGEILNKEDEIPHISKVLEKNFGFIASILEDKNIHHHVRLKKDVILKGNNLVEKVREHCRANNLTKAFVKSEGESIIIEVGAPLNYDFLENFGMVRSKVITRFGTRLKHYHLEDIEGLRKIEQDGVYESEEIRHKEQRDKYLETIRLKNNDASFHQKLTKYVFEIGITENDKQIARQFKDLVEAEGKIYFKIRDFDLIITPENEKEYKEIIEDIKYRFPYVIIEEKKFSKTYKIEFGKGDSSEREKIIKDIKKQLNSLHFRGIEYESIQNSTRVEFTYQYQTEDERDRFKNALNSIMNTYKNLMEYEYEYEDGTTKYTFLKNEKLEEDKEKEILNNIRRATFVYMTSSQYNSYKKSLERFGDDAYAKNAIQIGSFVEKKGNKFTFKLSEAFDKYITGSGFLFGEQEDLKLGYIKPIFPGEMTNIKRMVNAMNKVTKPGENRNGYPVNRNLPNFIFDPTSARYTTEDINEEKKRILSNLNEKRLANQPKQLEAVAKAMLARDLALIQGPPGTGKTTVIAEIIWQTLSRNPDAKVLVTSQTNLAVDNALERLKGKKLVRPIRIGKIDKFEDEGKVYSSERLSQWHKAKINSIEEENNSDNAINEWIKNVKEQCSVDSEYSEIVNIWLSYLDNGSQNIKEKFYNSYLDNINVFAATCSECGSTNFSDVYQQLFQKESENIVEPEFDVVIMDEASKATPPELILPLTLGKKVVIIGDHKQLPPMIDEKEFGEALDAVGAKHLVETWTREDYKISQFEKLFVNAPEECVASLDTQFRMHKQIMDCISQFYRDQKQLKHGLICGIEAEMDIPDINNKGSRWHGLQLAPFIDQDVHAIWVNVHGDEARVGTSYKNENEIEAIKLVINALIKSEGFKDYYEHFEKEEEREIGIITYYMPQMQYIKHSIYPKLKGNDWRKFEQHKYDNEFGIPFRINTVDRFQGMERNIIIISTVRSNLPASPDYKFNKFFPQYLGFAKEIPRVNVGFSRAKRLLIVIGNKEHFARKEEYAEAISKMHVIDLEQLKNL